MKQILKIALIGFFIILVLPLLLISLSDFTGIGAKEDGFKVYETYSPVKEGQYLINQYKIKCVAKDVESIAFIDIKRGKTFFAYNIDHNNYFFYEDINYDKVPEDIVKQYQFTVHFSWIETYGKYIVNSIVVICIILLILGWWLSRRNKLSNKLSNNYYC